MNKTLTKFKTSLNIIQQNKITGVTNELTRHVRESTLHDAHIHISIMWGVWSSIIPK